MDGAKFAARCVAWSLGLFGLLRLSWTEVHVVLPLTLAQGRLATALVGAPTLPVDVTLACSGADAFALCLGAILAYPVRWRSRLAGAGGGAALILALNTMRIGTLGRAAASPAWFNALHVYVWPALLAIAIAGYVFAWMRLADRPRSVDDGGSNAAPPAAVNAGPAAPKPTWRFVAHTGIFLFLFAVASPLYLESPGVLALARFITRAAATVLGVVGVSAYASANVLWTPRGGFLVTQECISTPLIPIYLAAVCTFAATWRRLMLGVLAAVPLFIALGIVRLLVVALPGAVVASPLFLVHAFYQLLLGAVVVFAAAVWRHGRSAASWHALAGLVVGLGFTLLLGRFYTGIVTYPGGTPLEDPQGAIALLPGFQIGLYLAIWIAAFATVGWRLFVLGLGVLALTQTTGLLALQALANSGLTAHVRDIRGWAVIGPLLIVASVVSIARPRR